MLKLFSHIKWSFFGTVISKGLTFIAWILVANLVGKEVNGEIGILRSNVNLFVSFVGSAFGLTLTKFIAEYVENNIKKASKIVSATLLLSLFLAISLSILFFISSRYIAETIIRAPHLFVALRICAGLLFLTILNGVAIGLLSGFEKFKEISIVNICQSVSLIILLYLGTTLFSLNGIMAGFAISYFVSIVLSLFYTWTAFKKSGLRLTWSLNSEWIIFYKFTLPAMLTGLMVVPFKWVLDAILVRTPNGFSDMGLYTALLLIQTFLVMMVGTINSPLITLMSKNNGKKNQFIESLSMLLPWVIGIIASVLLIAFPDILGLILSKEYISDDQYGKTLLYVVMASVFLLYKSGMYRIMIVNNLMWLSFFSNLVWGLILIVTFYFFTEHDAVGMAFSYMIAYLVNILIVLPVYIYRDVVPRHLILTWQSLGIWICFGVLVLVSFYDIQGVSRYFICIIDLCVVIILFYKLFFNEKKESVTSI